MNYFLLIASASEDLNGASISALEMANRRLGAKSWGLWANTPHKKEIAPEDILLVYIAGVNGRKFIATAKAEMVRFGDQPYVGDGNALTDPPCAVIKLKDIRRFDAPIFISEIKDELEFIPKNVARWGCVLQRGVKRISSKDASTILVKASLNLLPS